MPRNSYVPDWAVSRIRELQAEGVDINSTLYLEFPHISPRTLRSYTLSVQRGDYRTELIAPHYTKQGYTRLSLVDESLSRWGEYITQMRSLMGTKKKKDQPIKLANIQDVHIETSDVAVLNLVLSVLRDFQPDYVPVMCDVTDNPLFGNRHHDPTYFNMGTEFQDGTRKIGSAGAARIFEETTLHYCKAIRNVVGDECILPVWLGNHEAWAFQQLLKNIEFAEYFIPRLLNTLYAEYKVLWADSDTRATIPVTDNVLGLHGWSIRKGVYGSNANNYLKHYQGMSTISGHSHRAELAWGQPDYNTQGRNFSVVCGTLGTLRPRYRQHDYTAHTMNFTLCQLAPMGNVGHIVTPVDIFFEGGYYWCSYNGVRYQEKATYDFQAELNPLYNVGGDNA